MTHALTDDYLEDLENRIQAAIGSETKTLAVAGEAAAAFRGLQKETEEDHATMTAKRHEAIGTCQCDLGQRYREYGELAASWEVMIGGPQTGH